MKISPLSLKNIIIERASKLDNRKYAVLDFDNTCIINDIEEATFAFLCRNHLLKDTTLIRNQTDSSDEYHKLVFYHYYDLLRKKEVKEAYTFCASVLSGFTEEEIVKIVSEVIIYEGNVAEEIELYGVKIAKGIFPRKNVISLINFLESKDIEIWIVSASSEIIIKSIIKKFGIPGKVIGVKNKIKNGVIQKEFEIPIPIIEGKVDCIKLSIDSKQRPLIAIGDSINDIPMLEMADIKVVVGKNPFLLEKAKSLGWFII